VYSSWSSCDFEYFRVALVLLSSFVCFPRPVMRTFAWFLLCFARTPVLGFPTGLYPVGLEGRIHCTGVCDSFCG